LRARSSRSSHEPDPRARSHSRARDDHRVRLNDVGAVVDHIRALRHVDKINLAAWLAARAPADTPRSTPTDAAAVCSRRTRAPGLTRRRRRGDAVVFNRNRRRNSTRTGIARSAATIKRQVGERAVWADMASIVGSTWGAAFVARAVPSWGFNRSVVSKTDADADGGRRPRQQVARSCPRARTDLGAQDKVFVDLACSSHNAMWEKTTRCCSRPRSVVPAGDRQRPEERDAEDRLQRTEECGLEAGRNGRSDPRLLSDPHGWRGAGAS
jgi:hypothetical protein